MSLPANWSTVTVTGTYLNVDGEPLKGTVAFSTSARVVDAAANVTVPPGVRQVSLDKDGKFSLVLPATDDPDVAPTGFTYRVDENLVLPSGVRSLANYLILLPAATPTVDLADVVPVTAVAAVSPYLRAVDIGTTAGTVAAGNDSRITSAYSLTRPGNATIFLGDSNTRNLGDEPQAPGLLGYRGQSWTSMACTLSGERIHYLRNSGVPGDTTTLMIARFAADVAAYDPACVVIMAGTNDAGQSLPLATISANLQTLVGMTRAAGAVPVLCTIPPTNDPNPADRRTRVAVLNQWIKQYAAANAISLLDVYSVLVDEANGGLLAAFATDTVHFNAAGHFAVAQMVAAQLAPQMPAWTPPVPVDAGPTNLLVGPLFLTDSNADGVGDGWSSTAAPGATFSIVADAAIPGSWARITAAGSTATAQLFQTIPGITAGNRYRFVARVKVDSYTSGSGAVVRVRARSSTFAGLADGELIRNMTQLVDGIAVIDFTAPAGTVDVQVFLQAQAGTVTVRMAQVGVYDLTALGLA